MNVAVIKLGSRISFNSNDTSGANGEARSIIKMLQLGGANVHIFTKILRKDNLLPQYSWYDIERWYAAEKQYQNINKLNLDVLLVINGNVNFFGGSEDRAQIMNYAIINNFKGPMYYAYCDPELTLKQIWPSVQRKEWASNWAEKDLNIVRDDIIYLSQPFDVLRVMKDFKKNEVKPMNICHFPFEKFPCLNDPLPYNPAPEVDLSYGGTMRGGKRYNKMMKFYFGHPPEIEVEMFGKITEKDFEGEVARVPRFSGPIRYDEMLPKMNKSLAHCVIGDPYYEEINDLPQRTYESVWSSVVTFIDHDMDKFRRVYGKDKVLADFLYVQNRQELSEKILLLKADPNLRRQILEDQIKAVNFDPHEYSKKFVEALIYKWWYEVT